MTRGRVYRGEEANLRGIGVILVGGDSAIKGSRPGAIGAAAAIEQERQQERTAEHKLRMRLSRERFRPPARRRSAIRVPQADRVAVTTQRVARTLPAEMPAVPEWDNPFVKSRFTKAESRHRSAMRNARIKATSDPVNPVIRSEVIKRDASTCWICRTVLPKSKVELDHVIPLALGGKHVPENVRVACRSCNAWHGDRIITPIRDRIET